MIKDPGGHGEQYDRPVEAATLPLAHGAHAALPVSVAYCPDWQLAQGDVPPCENCPGPHITHCA